MSKLTINGLRRSGSYQDSEFQHLYERLFSSKSPVFEEEEKRKLLKWAIYFFNSEDGGVKRLGYRIIVRYANLYNDFIPLYDVSINAGFIPISKFIETNFLSAEVIGESFTKTLLSAYKDLFKEGDKYLSVGQKELIDFSKSVVSDTLIVAPTSYGKSEMIISKVASNLNKKICIIVPSKALLAQTKRRLMEDESIATTAKRIITYPEMYRADDPTFVAVLTQERLLRLMQKEPDLSIDILMVDEAHNLLDGEERGSLLLQVLLILKHRNPDIELKFYTPFLADSKSIETPYSNYSLDFRHVKEFIKIEKFFVLDNLDKGGSLSLYDQFIDKYIPIASEPTKEMDFIIRHKAQKNIVYLNKPRAVEDVAMKLSGTIDAIDLSGSDTDFKHSYDAIADFLHPDYKLLSCIKKGVIYHHGRIPEIIRLYVERMFSKHPLFSFIVTSSTLLEGVNIPAEKMFLLDVKKGRKILRRSSFKNLTGRACRFSEIFSNDNGSLRMLEPEIYIVNGQYMSSKFSVKTFFKTKAKWQDDEKDQDEVGNILLKKEYEDDEEYQAHKAIEYIENIEPGTIDGAKDLFDLRYVSSDIGKYCFKNNIHEFDIHLHEKRLVSNLASVKSSKKIDDVNTLLENISAIFINNIEHKDNDSFVRLENKAAQNFYSMILSWKMKGASFKEMIGSILRHWEERQEKAKSGDDHKIYVGHSWGEVKRMPDEFMNNYIDLRQKVPAQRVNIAIIRIKEEQDFVDYNLMKYIEVLNDLQMLDQNFYEHLKYGSSDPKVICMLKNGISMDLAKRLLNGSYDSYLNFDLSRDNIKIKRDAISKMEEEGENRILIFELEFHAS